MSGKVGVRPTLLSQQINELKDLRERLQVYDETDVYDSSFRFCNSKGPCAEVMTLYDQEYSYKTSALLWRLVVATIDYLEDAKHTLSPL